MGRPGRPSCRGARRGSFLPPSGSRTLGAAGRCRAKRATQRKCLGGNDGRQGEEPRQVVIFCGGGWQERTVPGAPTAAADVDGDGNRAAPEESRGGPIDESD